MAWVLIRGGRGNPPPAHRMLDHPVLDPVRMVVLILAIAFAVFAMWVMWR
jgi:hypothetical protein